MCAIVGLWHRQGGAADPREVAAMLAPLGHRGPDDQGTWVDGAIALGHLRLTILDPSPRAHQPMVTAAGDGVLVYNGEIYNFRELRAELEAEGVSFRTTGDSEVVLQLLHRWGPEKAIPRLNGMFALAYLDRREPTLWLARDRLGIKPLMVSERGSTLLFASEVKGLLAHASVPTRPCMQAVLQYLLRGRSESRFTGFDGIEGVEPGSWWKITSKAVEKRRYFHILDAVDVDRLVAAARTRPATYVDEFERAFSNSVRLHLASDVPLATLCSGGVDSSLVTAFAHDDAPAICAYVADLDHPQSEAPQARKVAAHLGVSIRSVGITRETHLRTWPQAVWFNEQPCYQASDAALLTLLRACRRDGFKVLLSGEGADELFGGYGHYASSYRYWGWWRGRKGRSALTPLKNALSRQDPRLRLHLLPAVDLQAELRPYELFTKLAPIRPAADRAFLVHCLDDLYSQLDNLLRRHDRMGMGASVELRVPFLENDVIDLALHLPRRAKLHRGQSKWVVKQAAERRLPREVVHARKIAFSIPSAFEQGTEAMLRGGAVAELLRLPTRNLETLIGLLNSDRPFRFHLVGLELWARMFLQGEKLDELGERLIGVASS